MRPQGMVPFAVDHIGKIPHSMGGGENVSVSASRPVWLVANEDMSRRRQRFGKCVNFVLHLFPVVICVVQHGFSFLRVMG